MWIFALPDNLIKAAVEDSISSSGKTEIKATIHGLRKGMFFNVYAESLDLSIGGTTALRFTDISCRVNPLYLFKKKLVFSVTGKMGSGNIKGFLKFPVFSGESDEPEKGNLKIERAEISAIPYLASAGFEGNGLISAELNLNKNFIDATFKIPDADIHLSSRGLPLLLRSFHKIQGALSLKDNTVYVKSISLEGDKGYARLKGNIKNNFMNLALEVMPVKGKLNQIESIFIKRYQASPGYYIIPIKGPLI